MLIFSVIPVVEAAFAGIICDDYTLKPFSRKCVILITNGDLRHMAGLAVFSVQDAVITDPAAEFVAFTIRTPAADLISITLPHFMIIVLEAFGIFPVIEQTVACIIGDLRSLYPPGINHVVLSVACNDLDITDYIAFSIDPGIEFITLAPRNLVPDYIILTVTDVFCFGLCINLFRFLLLRIAFRVLFLIIRFRSEEAFACIVDILRSLFPDGIESNVISIIEVEFFLSCRCLLICAPT